MSDNQKNSPTLLENERIRKELSKRFGLKRYWTFREGINFFLPVEYRNSFPLSVIIDDYLFDCMKQDVEPEGDTEVQRLKTFNSVKDAEQILADINSKAQWSTSKKGRKLSFDQIQEEERRYFCSKIKIKPEILICYIIDHIDLFSSEVEIPPKLQDWLSTVKELPATVENKEVIKPTKEEVEELLTKVSPDSELKFIDIPTNHIDLNGNAKLDHLIKKVTPEINILYEEIKRIAKKDRRNTQDLRYQDGKSAFENLKNKFQEIEFNDLDPDHFGTTKPFRDIKGGLLRKVVIRTIPKLIGNRKDIKIDGQALYKRMTDLKKTS